MSFWWINGFDAFVWSREQNYYPIMIVSRAAGKLIVKITSILLMKHGLLLSMTRLYLLVLRSGTSSLTSPVRPSSSFSNGTRALWSPCCNAVILFLAWCTLLLYILFVIVRGLLYSDVTLHCVGLPRDVQPIHVSHAMGHHIFQHLSDTVLRHFHFPKVAVIRISPHCCSSV